MKSLHRARRLARKLGPGLITGAADDDPSGLATYSQTGAQFGTGLVWTLALTTPLMIAVQMVSARIGWLTGQGLAANMRRVFPAWLTMLLVALLVFANTLNIAADIAAMGEALQMIIGGPEHGHALIFGAACAFLPLMMDYETLVSVLKWLTLSLLSYVAVIMMLDVNWSALAMDAIRPHFQNANSYWTMVVAVLGTTISPYLFFWQAAQEAEMRRRASNGAHALKLDGKLSVRKHLKRIRIDTIAGMLFSNLIAFCVMVATAITLHQHGITDIQTTRQAAEALRPVAGNLTFFLFAMGIIGTGMLAVPVLAASAAYAVADTMGWRAGMDHDFAEARGFFSMIVASTLLGTLIDFTPLDPIKALVWSAIVNGVIAVPIMAAMMWLGSRRELLGDNILNPRHRILGWIATAVMAVAVVAMLII